MRKQSADKEVSNVTYIEVVSEKADSKHTLIGVVSQTQQVLVQELGQRYIIIVGDAKSALCRYDVQFGINSTDMKHMTPSYSSVWPVTLVRLVVEQYCSTDMRTEPSDQLPMPQRV